MEIGRAPHDAFTRFARATHAPRFAGVATVGSAEVHFLPPEIVYRGRAGAKTYHGSLLLHPALVCEVPATEADPKAATTRARHMMSVGRIVVLL